MCVGGGGGANLVKANLALQILVSERNEQITLLSCFTKDRLHFITLFTGPPFFLLLYTTKIHILLSTFVLFSSTNI